MGARYSEGKTLLPPFTLELSRNAFVLTLLTRDTKNYRWNGVRTLVLPDFVFGFITLREIDFFFRFFTKRKKKRYMKYIREFIFFFFFHSYPSISSWSLDLDNVGLWSQSLFPNITIASLYVRIYLVLFSYDLR